MGTIIFAMNKLSNVMVWEQYRLLCSKDGMVDLDAAGIRSVDGVEAGWMVLKHKIRCMDSISRYIYNGVINSQIARMWLVLEYDKKTWEDEGNEFSC